MSHTVIGYVSCRPHPKQPGAKAIPPVDLFTDLEEIAFFKRGLRGFFYILTVDRIEFNAVFVAARFNQTTAPSRGSRATKTLIR